MSKPEDKYQKELELLLKQMSEQELTAFMQWYLKHLRQQRLGKERQLADAAATPTPKNSTKDHLFDTTSRQFIRFQ